MLAEDQVSAIVTAVRGSAAYKTVSGEFVADIARRELAKGRSMKEAVKATKNKLHQVAGAYVAHPRYEAWFAELEIAHRSGDPAALRSVCRRIMAFHSSTRERLPILDEFYATTLARCGTLNSVLDLACGLNPLTIPWLPWADGASYHAIDIYEDMMVFIGRFLALLGLRGRAEARNVLGAVPRGRVDLALVLKTIPCLEQVDREAGLRLLDAINAPYVLVSYPVASLGGRNKGMLATYEGDFAAMVGNRRWSVQRFVFATELAFLIRTE